MLHTQYFPSAFPFLEEFVSHVLVDYFCQLLRYYQAVWTIIFTFIWVLFLAIFCRSIKITFCCLLSTICKEFICEFLPFLAQDTNKFDFVRTVCHIFCFVGCMGTVESRLEPLIDHLRRVLSQLQGHRWTQFHLSVRMWWSGLAPPLPDLI